MKDSQTVRNKTLWTDGTKIEPFGIDSKNQVWRKPALLISCRDMLQSSKDECSNSRDVLEENLFQRAHDLRLGQRFTFQQDNDPEHKANTAKQPLHKISDDPAGALT